MHPVVSNSLSQGSWVRVRVRVRAKVRVKATMRVTIRVRAEVTVTVGVVPVRVTVRDWKVLGWCFLEWLRLHNHEKTN